MYTTSHQPMRTRTITTEDKGCIRIPRQGRSTERRRAIAESAAIR